MEATSRDNGNDLLREAMVRTQLRGRGIDDERVLAAMSRVQRHLFVPGLLEDAAYDDHALPIGHGQTISQPYMVALMVQALELRGNERVLDVGTGSGYQAAILGEIGAEIWSVEIIPELADTARARLAELGYSNVHVLVGDGSIGLSDHAPYDAIVVAAGSPEIPATLVEQLAPGGRLVIPVGPPGVQELLRIRRHGDRTTTEPLLGCTFVPLVGAEGWTRGREYP